MQVGNGVGVGVGVRVESGSEEGERERERVLERERAGAKEAASGIVCTAMALLGDECVQRVSSSKKSDDARRALESVEHDRNPLVLAQVGDSLRS